jgi:three-Cys-motif partner protein
MSKKHDTLWDAEPHTIAKIEILKGYLLPWFQIMCRAGKTSLYIDGFAGPGRYHNHAEGSPVAALIAAANAIEDSPTAEIHCAFIEDNEARHRSLLGEIKRFCGRPRLHVHTYHADFVKGLKQLERDVPAPFSGNDPLLVFADPFGATGVPFDTISSIMRSPTSEVLINLDADGIGRIFLANNRNREEQLTEIFGDDSWKRLENVTGNAAKIYREILNLYTGKLLSLTDVDYVFPFEMRSSRDTLNYFLVFASRHPKGLEKMKESMKRMDQTGTYCFSDADVGQHRMFKSDDVDFYAGRFADHFVNRRITYDNANTYALNETPFTNPKAILRKLEESERLSIGIKPGVKRRKGTFSENDLEWIECHPSSLLFDLK